MPRPRARDANASRLATHPAWLWDVFTAAREARSYSRTFPGRNFAVNARHRYHEFRRDCIHEGVPMAAIMTEMVCSLSKSPPWALTWTFIGRLEDYQNSNVQAGSAPIAQGAQAPQAPEGPIRQLGDTSESEALVEAWLRKGREPTPAPKASDLDIPSLDTSTGNEPLPPCPPHEEDELAPGFCIKCRMPMQ